jgi:transcriptional regulator with XRE-family HTH domain
MLTPAQSRAARGLLGWSQSDLAGAGRVSLSTVRDFEKSRWTPIENSLAAMRQALEAAGAEFTNGSASGVRLRPKPDERIRPEYLTSENDG